MCAFVTVRTIVYFFLAHIHALKLKHGNPIRVYSGLRLIKSLLAVVCFVFYMRDFSAALSLLF